MSDNKNLNGGCLCGALRYTATAKPFAADYCHCRNCQRSTGSPVSAWMDFKKPQLTWEDSSALREYESSEHTRRGFCSQCGSTLSYRDIRHPDYYSVAITSLDDPDQVQPTYHIHTESQPGWFKIDDDCKRYPQGQT